MKITAYRITKKEFAATIWSGVGARDFGGRWNSKGLAVVYTAESRSLAALEQLVHLVKPRILAGFVVAGISFDSRQVKRILPRGLPPGWDAAVAPPNLKKIGDSWLMAGRYPVLAVPSAVIAGEFNFLLNPAHTDFARMAKSSPEPFIYDTRLG